MATGQKKQITSALNCIWPYLKALFINIVWHKAQGVIKLFFQSQSGERHAATVAHLLSCIQTYKSIHISISIVHVRSV